MISYFNITFKNGEQLILKDVSCLHFGIPSSSEYFKNDHEEKLVIHYANGHMIYNLEEIEYISFALKQNGREILLTPLQPIKKEGKLNGSL